MLLILFSLSIVFDFLQFFLFSDRTNLGISLSASRALQVVVLALIVTQRIPVRLSAPPGIKLLLFFNIFYVFLCAVVGAVLMSNHPIVHQDNARSFGENYVFIQARGLIESFLIVFNAYYYLVVGQYLISSKRHLMLFLRLVSFSLFFSMFVGYFEFLLKLFGFNIIGRHIAYYPNIVDIGFRFHGLFGEPRDSVFPLLFGIFLAFVLNGIEGTRFTYSRVVFYFAYILAVILTYSVSGYLGIALGCSLFLFDILRKAKLPRLSSLGVLLSGLILVGYFFSTWRVQYYLDVYSSLNINNVFFGKFTSDELTQIFNIVPILYYFKSFVDGNFAGTIFGYGIGYSALSNSRVGLDGIAFPSSEGVRILVERGVFGLILFLMMCFQSVKIFENSFKPNKVGYVFLIFCLFGSFFAHRTHGFWCLLLVILSIHEHCGKKSDGLPL